MNNQTSSKNIIIGFALGVIITATLGATLKHNNEVGRFQIAAGANEDAFVVDTVTGEVWSRRPSATRSAVEFNLPKAEKQ